MNEDELSIASKSYKAEESVFNHLFTHSRSFVSWQLCHISELQNDVTGSLKHKNPVMHHETDNETFFSLTLVAHLFIYFFHWTLK